MARIAKRKAPGVKGTESLTRAREGIRTPNLLIRSSLTRLPKRIRGVLVFSKLFSFTLESFPIVSVKPARSCSPATKLRPLFTAPKMKRFGILTIYSVRFEAV
jgi:hypothetical protein